MITLSAAEWAKLSVRLTEDHCRSTMLLRNKQKEVLGFTVRYGVYEYSNNVMGRGIFLDFFDDTQETWFRLHYL
jgi:hypothetical protein